MPVSSGETGVMARTGTKEVLATPVPELHSYPSFRPTHYKPITNSAKAI